MGKKKQPRPAIQTMSTPPHVVLDHKGQIWVNGCHVGQIWREASRYELGLMCEALECEMPVLFAEDFTAKPVDG